MVCVVRSGQGLVLATSRMMCPTNLGNGGKGQLCLQQVRDGARSPGWLMLKHSLAIGLYVVQVIQSFIFIICSQK